MKSLLHVILFSGLMVWATDQARLLPAQPQDMVPVELVALESVSQPLNRETQPIAIALPVAREALQTVAPFMAQSRGYHFTVSADQMVGGVSLDVTDPGALIRIHAVRQDASALDRNAAIDPSRLVLVTEKDQVFERGSGFELLVTAEQLEASGASPFPQGTSVFRIRKDLGAGRFWLFADGLDRDPNEPFGIHVFERDSATVLGLQAGSHEYLAGAAVDLQAHVDSPEASVTMEQVHAVLVSPGGERFELDTKLQEGQLHVSGVLPQVIQPVAGLWEVELSTQGQLNGSPFRRDVRTGFAVGLPTARFNGKVELKSAREQNSLQLGVQVATPARYEARGVLMGTDVEGDLQAIAILNSAAVLPIGNQQLSLPLDGDSIKQSGLQAPFAIRDLTLINQDLMHVIQRMSSGIEGLAL